MKKSLPLLLILASITAQAQDLINSRQSSYYTFIYQLTNDEAAELYEKGKEPLAPKYFHTQVDQFPSDSIFSGTLPFGHYLFVSTEGGKFECVLESINNLDMKIHNNHRDLLLSFQEPSGKRINSFTPYSKKKKIKFDEKLDFYAVKKSNREGWIKAEHDGHINYFSIDRKYNNSLPKRVGRGIIRTFPINHLTSIIVYVPNSVISLIKYGSMRPPGIYYRAKRLFEDKNYEGYLVLNQPKYKPGDTVKVKAFVTTRKGKPVSKNVDLKLTSWSGGRYTKTIGSLKPYRKGAYMYEFVLDDSLKLSLGKEYRISLNDKGYNNYPSAQFDYEEYELKSNNYSLRSTPNADVNQPGIIFLKGTDSNELPLYDIRTTVTVLSKKVNDFYDPKIFIADTLWQHQLMLDPIGETKVVLPDSIFPNASFDYEVIVDFKNTENEVQQKNISLTYDQKPQIKMELRKDSVFFSNGIENKLYQLNTYSKNSDKIQSTEITLPHSEKVENFISHYTILEDQKQVKYFDLESESDAVEVMAERTKDSLQLIISNPRNIPFSYQLFKNNKIIKIGNGTQYTAKIKTNPNDNYYFSIQYSWADQSKNQDFDLPFAKKTLTIEINHPLSVFPGQTTDFTIHVADAFGKPVENTDLTAYSITKKFKDYNAPSVPGFEKFKSRKVFNEFNQTEEEFHTFTKQLNFNCWKSKIGLDSIEFYKFLYPGNTPYLNYSASEDSIPQIAPYLIKNGEIQTVHYIYFGKVLSYFSQAQSIEPYSFQSGTDTLQITLRLSDRLITIEKVVPRKGMKLILSIDVDNLPVGSKSVEKGNLLDIDETRHISSHFMKVKRDNTQPYVYLQQGDLIHALNPARYGSGDELVGPFYPGPVKYQADYNLDFYFKPKMIYTFQPSLIDRETDSYRFGNYLFNKNAKLSFKDQVQTEARIKKYWKSLETTKRNSFSKYPDYSSSTKPTGSLIVSNTNNAERKRLASFMLNLDEPEEYYIYPANQSEFKPLVTGLYQLIIIFDNGFYFKPAPIFITPYGRSFYDFKGAKLFNPDSLSSEIILKIEKWSTQSAYADVVRKTEMNSIRQLYYREEAQNINYTGGRWIRGHITAAEDGSPLPGVNVIVKGTTIGTVTDANGDYRIYVPENATLVISFIGMVSQEIDSNNQDALDVDLTSDVTQLSEVIVTGFGVSTTRMNLTSSVAVVSGLQGKVAGVSIDGIPGAGDMEIRIRGASALSSSSNPLVIIDGVIGDINMVDKNKITNLEVLKSAEATALYGSRGGNGVILISTKPGTTSAQLLAIKLPEAPTIPSLDGNMPGSSIRSNFRDYAFWEPNLRTNKNGKVSFQATFPDDITGWDIYVLGMASKKRTGATVSAVQSFKPLAAQLALPHFLIEGDTTFAIGKITNYTRDSLSVTKKVTINDHVIKNEPIEIVNSIIDSLYLIGAGTNLSVKYEIDYNDYVDGEIREIPVFKSGTKESQGIFVSLPKDSTFTFVANKHLEKGTLYIQADYLSVLQDEIRSLRFYPYECNEQLASKLKGYLAQKMIAEYRGDKFEDDAAVKKILKKISSHQSVDGGWSWWGSGRGSAWITLHVAEAFEQAEKLGYKIQYDKVALKNFFVSSYQRYTPEQQLKVFIYLAKKGEKVMGKALADSVLKADSTKSNYLRLLSQRLYQVSGEKVDWEWINNIRKETLKGNWYWGETKRSLWNNDLDNTLLVYQLMQHENPANENIYRLQNFFLEKRKPNWDNTYFSSKIIETIVPSMIKENSKYVNPTVKISGTLEKTVSNFPFEIVLDNTDSLVFAKAGSSPVYLTAYQDAWIKNPEKVGNEFIVQSAWSKPVGKLEAGKSINLIVNLEVKKDAEFVMLTVPIPAGCSYYSKEQSRSNREVHREYDLAETRIYCENLPAGKYTYSINLMPRYQGTYQLNPVKAEWMYFPVIFGRGSSNRISIE